MIARRYGHSRLHLIGHVLVIGLCAFVLSQMFQPDIAPYPVNLAAWLLGGALIHDLVLLPAYTVLDRAMGRVLGNTLRNHVRVPAAMAGVVLLVFAPRIFDRQPQNFERALGEPAPDYLGRWLVFCAVVFGVSALVALSRAAAGRLQGPPAAPVPPSGP